MDPHKASRVGTPQAKVSNPVLKMQAGEPEVSNPVLKMQAREPEVSNPVLLLEVQDNAAMSFYV